jgi:hypothetical protein
MQAFFLPWILLNICVVQAFTILSVRMYASGSERLNALIFNKLQEQRDRDRFGLIIDFHQ